ncbi:MAG: hypothetical protein HY343_07810 [Lentisphaerae bacterium]|nr:hypothetical protein [Lentisphaerota bacterium]
MRNDTQVTRWCKLGVAMAAILAQAAFSVAGEDSYEKLVARWKNEREVLLRNMARNWLQGRDDKSVTADVMTLSRLESGLATRPENFLYLGAIENASDPHAIAGAVVAVYLKKRGVLGDSADFFRGKTFGIVKETVKPAPTTWEEFSTPVRPARRVIPAGKTGGMVTEIETTETQYTDVAEK